MPEPSSVADRGPTAGSSGLDAETAGIEWYHTIELPGGVVTPGRWDLRGTFDELPFPASLSGLRCLDVATFDGFWAFAMERRGAEVVGVDLADPADWDWPAPGRPSDPEARVGGHPDWQNTDRGFDVAHRALGSRVERRDMSVHELSPESVGEFDLAFVGSVLVHLRDPAGALNAIRSVTRGRLLVFEPISLPLSILLPRKPAAMLDELQRPFWWTPNVAGLKRLVARGGFEILGSGAPVFVPRGEGLARRPTPVRELRPAKIAQGAMVSLLGVPQAWVLAQPASSSGRSAERAS